MLVDCFAFAGGELDENYKIVGAKCLALTTMLCNKRCYCPFYKTQRQFDIENEKAVERLKRIGLYEYSRIKYFNKKGK